MRDATIFQKSVAGRICVRPPKTEALSYDFDKSLLRENKAELPEVSELDLVRHYEDLSSRAFGVDNGFYPLGSCTMKYNPKLNEAVAGLSGFTDAHPLQECGKDGVRSGLLEVFYRLGECLKDITGMDSVTLQPAAGAHGEFTALLIVKEYFKDKGEKRREIIVPDSAHGTNPASAGMAGFDVLNIPSRADGSIDIDALRRAVSNNTAALMMTNPNTLGLFEGGITEIAGIIHGAGAVMYYDGANLNAIAGVVRPGDIGFDIMHVNLHKTFATPHGGGGPGSGPVLCKGFLADFLPYPNLHTENGRHRLSKPKKTVGRMKIFYGNFLVLVRALCYIAALGGEGIKRASELAVLNANYMRKKVSVFLDVPHNISCMHEFVASCEKLKKETGVSALDVAKALIDKGIHPPTIYFPLVIHEAMMFEPTETESKQAIDEAVDILEDIIRTARTTPERVKAAPLYAPISRPDETAAARKPVLKH